MQQLSAGSILERPLTRWTVLAVIGLLFATTNLPWHLDDYDQAKQAFTSFEMVSQNHWLYQHTPNDWVATKPPLVGWVSAALFALTRNWEIAWRLPSLVAAVALVLLVGRAATQAFGASAGLIAASACGLNFFAPRLATLVRTDMALALVTFLIGALIWTKVRSGIPWSTRDRAIAFALLTAAMLIKGPIVWAFLLPGIVAFRLLAPQSARNAWSGWWPWIASLAVFVLWLAIGIYSVPEFFENVVIREFGGRFEGTHRAQPLYFYLPYVLYKFAPWCLLLATFAIAAAKLAPPGAKPWRNISAGTLWLICWSAGGIVVMSLIPSKRVDRIFPAVPPLCLLVAAQFAHLRMTARHRLAETAAVAAVLIACVFTAAFSAAKIIPAYRDHRDAYALFGRKVRAEAVAHSLRYAVIGGEDEGILLYLRQPKFAQPPNAVYDWQGGAINGIVAPEDEIAGLMQRLPDAAVSPIGWSGATGSHGTRYALLVRR